ncbi:hypothetical protein NL676_017767 [Syzygium grande]|nr:hypothetical protein NL676_017767 [Syzygium grande]
MQAIGLNPRMEVKASSEMLQEASFTDAVKIIQEAKEKLPSEFEKFEKGDPLEHAGLRRVHGPHADHRLSPLRFAVLRHTLIRRSCRGRIWSWSRIRRRYRRTKRKLSSTSNSLTWSATLWRFLR